jgi:hypothetical protein
MWDWIVLGVIPGTNIQVSFENWLWTVATLSVAYALIRELRTKRMLSFVLLYHAALTATSSAKAMEQLLTRQTRHHIQA